MVASNDFTGKRVAVVVAGPVNGEIGGAERFYSGLRDALAALGPAVDLINVPIDEATYEHILGNYERCRSLDLSTYDLVISTKAPTYAVRHPNHVVYLVHAVRAYYDMFDRVFPAPSEEVLEQRRRVHELDTEALLGVKARFAIGYEVASRMRRWNGLDAEVLHPPLGMNRFREGRTGDYFFLPGRLHPWKRVDLAIRAVQGSAAPIRLVVAGTGEAEEDLRTLAGADPRIEFLGRVSDDQLVNYYADCLAVLFLPTREDYGYVTLEAFASAKPVITCRDSGEPLQFVAHERTGWICEPTAESLREIMEHVLEHPEATRRLGENGRACTRDITWPDVAERLLAAGFAPAVMNESGRGGPSRKRRVAVLDMQPIDPPVGGGRLRLLGLYHALGDDFETRYIGTYDWPGEQYRRHHLSASLEEIDVPLSDAHHAAARKLSEAAGGKVVIDVAFPRLGHLSPDYLDAARQAVEWAEIVVFSHPWVYPLVADRVRVSQPVVYDSQNVEGFLRAQLLDGASPTETELRREVVEAEYQVGSRADLVLACSQEDAQRFARIYDWPFRKMRVLPNGVMASALSVPNAEERGAAKRAVGLDRDRLAAIFIGSAYGPNVEAGRFIVDRLAPALPDLLFVIAGGVGSALSPPVARNVVCTGQLDEAQKIRWLMASDIGINPMFSGSGTNIKMFDLMAAGLPVVSTAVGARGITAAGSPPFLIAEPTVDSFVAALRALMTDPHARADRSRASRACVDDGYSWERISPHLGELLRAQLNPEHQPFFSVVIPTYDRHETLEKLMDCLEEQSERDFEVVVVDQSPVRWSGEAARRGFPVRYVHTEVRGAVRARNTGADLARGAVIAFTDDDCRPGRDWLSAARVHFERREIVGLEGLVESDHLDDPAYRPVTNVGFEGIGFMTANLFVTTEAFHQLGGFDLAFDRPHFREDTDFGWRMQRLGDVPYASDVRVFHPAQPRAIERESAAARASFFEKDALLLSKHPIRYRQLFELERHWEKTPGFWDNFRRGAEVHRVNIDEYLCFEPGRSTAVRVELFQELLREAEPHQSLGAAPASILRKLDDARPLVEALAETAAQGTHGEYFRVSKERYAHYLAACMVNVQPNSRILDVGNAPGHFGYLLSTVGHTVKGLNLNSEWRATYPDPTWLDLLGVTESDIESDGLPFPDRSFDAIVFTEVLEHIAIKDPVSILAEFKRVLVPGGVVIFSTPNVCNLSNVIALMLGKNVFWPSSIFYGSLDRHNREWTPAEVSELFQSAGFGCVSVWGMCDDSNWRTGAADFIYQYLSSAVDKFAMMRNTIVGVYRVPSI